MRRFLAFYALAATLLLGASVRHYRAENRRLAANQRVLAADAALYRARSDEAAASVQALRLRCAEFEALRADDAARIERMGVKLRRLEAAAKAVAESRVEVRAPLRDTLVVRLCDTIVRVDTVRVFRWRDAWVEVEGEIGADSLRCRVASVDTLRQVVHRIPRRFLFIRWGTKALRQEIRSSNPHSRIVYSEYVRIE